MKIIVIGAGFTGATVAETLVAEHNDVTVVDTNERRLQALQDRLDLRSVWGDGTLPSVLQAARAGDAELLLAVTDSDHVNLCICRTAGTLFNIPTKIAILRAEDYGDYPELLGFQGFSVDRRICPEQIFTQYIERLIEYPAASQILQFGAGTLTLATLRITKNSALVGRVLGEISSLMANRAVAIPGIVRDDQILMGEQGSLEIGDELVCLAATGDIQTILQTLDGKATTCKRIMIAGGGTAGLRLAKATQARYLVKLVELSGERVEHLSRRLSHTLVLHGDAADEALLANEGIGGMDFFAALTDDEETNIVACLLAKKMGARRVLALINRGVYANLVQSDRIDIALSPGQVVLGDLMTQVRHGDVVAVHSLRHGVAEVIEIVVHGDLGTSKVVGRRLDQLQLPKGALVGAVLRPAPQGQGRSSARNGALPAFQVLLATHTQIQAGDHVILLLADRKSVVQVEKLFSVGVYFI